MPKRILLVGGGSGGHVFPLVAVAESLRKLDPTVEMMFLGEGPFFATAAEAVGVPYKSIMAGKLRRYFSILHILAPFQAIVGFFQSLWLLLAYMPDVIFTKGGYVSVMPVFVAKMYMIPVYTHESDSVPGLANQIIGKIANKVFTSFESTGKYFNIKKAMLVGNPIRPEILNGDRDAALKQFNLRADRKTILVVGGSQGAKRINDATLEALVILVKDYQIIHQCGDSQLQAVQKVVEQYQKEGEGSYSAMIQANYRLYPFFNAQDMRMAYAAADVIISRGGASNLTEISLVGKPAIIIPLSRNASRGDQIQNSLEFAKYGAVVIEEANITSHIILNQIQNLLEPANYSAVSTKIKTFAKPDAADQIATILLNN